MTKVNEAKSLWLRIMASTYLAQRLVILARIDGCSWQDVARNALILYTEQRLPDINHYRQVSQNDNRT